MSTEATLSDSRSGNDDFSASSYSDEVFQEVEGNDSDVESIPVDSGGYRVIVDKKKRQTRICEVYDIPDERAHDHASVPSSSNSSLPTADRREKRKTRMSGKGAYGCLSMFDTDDKVRVVAGRYGIKEPFSFRCPQGSHRFANEPPPDYCTVYEAQLQSGLRFPLCPAILALLIHYGISISQLTPNAIRIILCFLIQCRVSMVCFSVDLFSHFFHISKTTDEDWYYFQRRQGSKELVEKQTVTSSHGDWKPLFFFVKHGVGISVGLWRDRGARGDKWPSKKPVPEDVKVIKRKGLLVHDDGV